MKTKRRRSLLNDLEEVLLKEKASWRQKTKIQRVKKGNDNAMLLNKVATRRKKKSLIKELQIRDG